MTNISVDSKYNFVIEETKEGIALNGDLIYLDMKSLSDKRFHILINNKGYSAEVVSVDFKNKEAIIKVNGKEYQVTLEDENAKLLESLGIELNKVQGVSNLKAPMPGLVLEVLVKPGEQLKKGDNLFVLEAMKMENLIKSPYDITIKSVEINKGDKVEKNQILLQFEPII